MTAAWLDSCFKVWLKMITNVLQIKY